MIRMRPLRRPLAAVTATLLFALTGCYSYSPVDDGAPEAGSEVRVRLNDEGAKRVSSQTYLRANRVLTGRILQAGTSELRLVISRPPRNQFSTAGMIRDTVTVPAAGIESTETKQVETGKTALLVGGITAGAVALGAVALSGGGAGGTPPNGGGGGEPFSISVPLAWP